MLLQRNILAGLVVVSLLAVVAFAPDGTIVFSTDPAEEGTVNNRPYFSEVVAAGRTYTSVVRKEGRTQEGRTVPVDVVETYVPVMRGGRFTGAFEIYLDITDRTAEVSRLLRRSNLTTGRDHWTCLPRGFRVRAGPRALRAAPAGVQGDGAVPGDGGGAAPAPPGDRTERCSPPNSASCR